jgi:hypothetical protein
MVAQVIGRYLWPRGAERCRLAAPKAARQRRVAMIAIMTEIERIGELRHMATSAMLPP